MKVWDKLYISLLENLHSHMDNILKPYSTYREAGTEPSFERRINDNYRAGHISPETRAEVEPYLSKEILLAADPPNEFIDYGPRY